MFCALTTVNIIRNKVFILFKLFKMMVCHLNLIILYWATIPWDFSNYIHVLKLWPPYQFCLPTSLLLGQYFKLVSYFRLFFPVYKIYNNSVMVCADIPKDLDIIIFEYDPSYYSIMRPTFVYCNFGRRFLLEEFNLFYEKNTVLRKYIQNVVFLI